MDPMLDSTVLANNMLKLYPWKTLPFAGDPDPVAQEESYLYWILMLSILITISSDLDNVLKKSTSSTRYIYSTA